MDPVSKEDKIWVMENFFKTKKFAEYNSVSDLLGNKIKLHFLWERLSLKIITKKTYINLPDSK